MRIKAYVGYNERGNTRIFCNFEIEAAAPAIGDTYNHEEVTAVYPRSPDYENSSECYEYDYFQVETEYKIDYDEDRTDKSIYYIAVKSEVPQED